MPSTRQPLFNSPRPLPGGSRERFLKVPILLNFLPVPNYYQECYAMLWKGVSEIGCRVTKFMATQIISTLLKAKFESTALSLQNPSLLRPAKNSGAPQGSKLRKCVTRWPISHVVTCVLVVNRRCFIHTIFHSGGPLLIQVRLDQLV